MPKPSAAVEVVEIVRPRQAEGGSGVEAGAMKRTDLILRVRAHGEAGERTRERGPDRVGRPAVVAGRDRPAVVVGRATHGDDAAVVGRAAADHSCPGKRDRVTTRQLSAPVAPVV